MAGLRTYIQYSSENETSRTLVLGKDESHHLARVMRVKEGDAVEVLDGCGHVWQTRVQKAHKTACEVEVLSHTKEDSRAPVFSVHCSLPKQKKMDLIVQQCTELGVAHIYPLVTSHTELKLEKGKEAERVAHWQRVAIEACKQSGNRFMPQIHEITKLSSAEIVEGGASRLSVVGSLQENSRPLREYDFSNETFLHIHLYVGPEGDFSREEYAWFAHKNLYPISLGKNVLRMETAVVAAISQLQAFFPQGDKQL